MHSRGGRRLISVARMSPAPPPTTTSSSSSSPTLPMTYERRIWETNQYSLVCGVDEAGRGPLAGPVVAAACIALPPSLFPPGKSSPFPEGVRDSKTVTEEEREALFPQLLSSPSLVFGVSVLDHAAIDSVNIFAASMLAMERATAAARVAAVARLGGVGAAAAGIAALPVEDTIDFGGLGGCPPSLPSPPSGLHPLTAIHTVFVDGPHCPPRIAAATDGGGYESSLAQAAVATAAATAPGGKKRKRSGEAAAAAAAAVESAAANEPPPPVKGRKAVTVVAPSLDAAVQSRLGPIHTAQPVIAGDSKVYTIAAASLVAKVTRDRLMRKYDALWPQYGFLQHKGYGTRDHMAAIAAHGPCPIHRRTFAPLKHTHPVAAAAAVGVEVGQAVKGGGKKRVAAAASAAAEAPPTTTRKKGRK